VAEIRGSEPACAGSDGLKNRSLWLRHVHIAEFSAAQTPERSMQNFRLSK
jgi:hypothetical protein